MQAGDGGRDGAVEGDKRNGIGDAAEGAAAGADAVEAEIVF